MNKDLRVSPTTNSNFLANFEGQFFISDIVLSAGREELLFEDSVATLRVDENAFRNVFTIPVIRINSFSNEVIRLRFHIKNKSAFFEIIKNFQHQLDKLLNKFSYLNSKSIVNDVVLSIKTLESKFCEELKKELFFYNAKRIVLTIELNYEIKNKKKKLIQNLKIDKNIAETKLDTQILNFLGKISAEKLFSPESTAGIGVNHILI